jgi:hypothetical protein
MVHEVSRTVELAERQHAHSIDHAGFEVEELRTWYVLSALGLVVKHVDAVGLRVVVASVALIVALHLLKLGAHLTTALARLHVQNLKRRSGLGAGEHAGENGGEERRDVTKFRVAVWHGKQEIPVVRERVSRKGKQSNFTTLTSRTLGAVQSTLGMCGCG